MISRTVTLMAGTVTLDVVRAGSGVPMLLLHGGAGPASMIPLVEALDGFDCILPTHPGFDATDRPDRMATISDLADCYVALLGEMGLANVVAVGNSAGGWIAAEMAARSSSLAAVVLIDAVGLEPTDSTGPIADPRSMLLQDLVKLSFSDPSRAKPPSPEAASQRQANQRVLATYAGEPFMYDPTLPERLGRIAVPSLVLWGSADGIVTPAYGREYARRIPGAGFQTIDDAGHLPQIEQPEQTARAIREFCATLSRSASAMLPDETRLA